MNRNTEILNELRELAPALAEIPHVNVFTVPQGYFDQLSAAILLQTGSEAGTGSLPFGNRETGFAVPGGYFEGLAGSIMNRIKTEDVSDAREEINILSPTLAGISREMPFDIPRSYFDNLTGRIMDERREAKVVNMMSAKRRIMPRWMKVAAAACIIGLLAFGTYRLVPWNKGGGTTGTGTTGLANNLPTKEDVKNFDLDKELSKLSGEDITNYLCETGAIACTDTKKDEELNKQISEISDDELDSYLEGIN